MFERPAVKSIPESGLKTSGWVKAAGSRAWEGAKELWGESKSASQASESFNSTNNKTTNSGNNHNNGNANNSETHSKTPKSKMHNYNTSGKSAQELKNSMLLNL